MSRSDHAAESEQEIRWRVWQGKRRRSDQLADRWMRIMFCAAAVILDRVFLYYWLRPNARSKGPEPAVASGNSWFGCEFVRNQSAALMLSTRHV